MSVRAGAAAAALLVLGAGHAVAGDAPGATPAAATVAEPPPPPTTTPAADEAPEGEPDPRAVAMAREANFEPLSVREGFAIGAALGPSMQLGFGIGESSGTGGGFGLRIGTVGSPRWVWLLELAATVYRRANDAGADRLNQSALLTFGGQLYLRDAIWVRGGAGFANFTRRSESAAEAESSFSGLGITAAAGYDLYQSGGLAWSIEMLALGARYADGTVLGGSVQVGFSYY